MGTRVGVTPRPGLFTCLHTLSTLHSQLREASSQRQGLLLSLLLFSKTQGYERFSFFALPFSSCTEKQTTQPANFCSLRQSEFQLSGRPNLRKQEINLFKVNVLEASRQYLAWTYPRYPNADETPHLIRLRQLGQHKKHNRILQRD